MPTKKRTRTKRPKRKRAAVVPSVHYVEGNGAGRPTKYVPEFARVAETMASAGSTDAEIARACNCAVSTLYRWKAEIPEFRESIKGAKQIPIGRVERSLFSRAVGYEHETDKIFHDGGDVTIVKTVERYPPDTAAARLWLLNTDPERWRDRHEVKTEIDDLRKTEEELTDTEIDEKLAVLAARRAARAKAAKAKPKK